MYKTLHGMRSDYELKIRITRQCAHRLRNTENN